MDLNDNAPDNSVSDNETADQFILRRLADLRRDEARGLFVVFSIKDIKYGVVGACDEVENRLRTPSPIPPWPENCSIGEPGPFYPPRQLEAGLRKKPRVYAPGDGKRARQ
jgi:hypothetical protein